MKKNKIGNFEISEIVYGMWRVSESKLTAQEIVVLLEGMLKLGINAIDTAEIYGNDYNDAEKKLGEAFELRPDLKEKFIIITKNGIVARDRAKTPHYDNSFDYIVEATKKSINAMNIEKIDVLLLHRPDIFADFSEIARAMKFLIENKMVSNFGVSNYTPLQFKALNKYLKLRGLELVTNQIEINPCSAEHFDNDNVFFLKGEEISPMIWSPMAGGKIFEENKINEKLKEIAKKHKTSIDSIVIAYLHNQGLNPVTILGSNKIERYESAIEALDLKLSYEEMYEIMKNITGRDVK